jgi:predicted glycogen debranching enzyme
MLEESAQLEWLQTNRRGSFAMGCVDRIPRRKYHSLLTLREPGFGDPLNILAEVGESIYVNGKTFLLHNISYGNHTYPEGSRHLISFTHSPRPLWIYEFDGIRLERELELDTTEDIVRIHYKVRGVKAPLQIQLEPLILCRPIHNLTRENPFLNGSMKLEQDGSLSMHPYKEPPVFFLNVTEQQWNFVSEGRWDKGVFYSLEQARGYDSVEDVFSPGFFQIEMKKDGEITFHLGTDALGRSSFKPRKRKTLSVVEELEEAADQYLIVKKNETHSIVAGYPWFEEWGRDTMLSLPGLCLTTGKLDFAQRILEDYAEVLMSSPAPGAPTLSGIPQNIMGDAPLLFVRAVQLLYEKAGNKSVRNLMPAVYSVLSALRQGADPRVEITSDGGIYFKPGPYAVSWMDVVIDGNPLTPRHGFAVDLNALFLNGIHFAVERARDEKNTSFSREWELVLEKADAAFTKRFWSDDYGYLADVHDGFTQDFSLRPNQLWATALPHCPVPAAAARKLIQRVGAELLTPVGLRTLSPFDPRYHRKYEGGQTDRDKAYHQGTVWPWLIGIYADSVLRFFGKKDLEISLQSFLKRIENHIASEGCSGQISEVFDGDEPHRPGGTPAQAWSVAEVLRVVTILRSKF